MNRRTLCTMITGLLAFPATAGAQQLVPKEVVSRVVDSIAAMVERNYVVADTGKMIADHLRARKRAGAYDQAMGGAQLSDRIGADLKVVNGDLHLYVTYGAPRAGAGPTMMRRMPGSASPSVPPQALEAARRDNYDLSRVERLPGNVGYLQVGLLSSRGIDEAYRVLDHAMSFLERTDAIIIDLRHTRGGDPRMADYLAGYFFGPDTVPTLVSSMGTMGDIQRFTARVQGKQRPDIPVYLLVGPGTFSGTEDFAFIIQTKGRGKLVGERTAGAGRLNPIFPVSDGFSVSISGGRTYDPRTKKEWERIGITPDIAVPVDDALTSAHAAALQEIASRTSDSAQRQGIGAVRTNLLARAHPASIRAATLKRYAGSYDLRLVTFRDGKLFYHAQAGRPGDALIPIDDHTFALGDASRVEFTVEHGRVKEMKVIRPDGQSSVLPRTTSPPVARP